MSIFKDLETIDPRIAALLNTKQYGYSKELIRVKHELGLNQFQMSKLLGLEYNNYLIFEFPYIDKPTLSQYEELFKNISKLTISDIELIKDKYGEVYDKWS